MRKALAVLAALALMVVVSLVAGTAALKIGDAPPGPAPSASPYVQPGIAVPGARCEQAGARRFTAAGDLATCRLGPDESSTAAPGGRRLEWGV